MIPTDVVDRVKAIASMNKLYTIRQLNVSTKPGGIPKRTLIAFCFSNRECVVEELLTELARHQYSAASFTNFVFNVLIATFLFPNGVKIESC